MFLLVRPTLLWLCRASRVDLSLNEPETTAVWLFLYYLAGFHQALENFFYLFGALIWFYLTKIPLCFCGHPLYEQLPLLVMVCRPPYISYMCFMVPSHMYAFLTLLPFYIELMCSCSGCSLNCVQNSFNSFKTPIPKPLWAPRKLLSLLRARLHIFGTALVFASTRSTICACLRAALCHLLFLGYMCVLKCHVLLLLPNI